MALKDAQQWLDPVKGEVGGEYITPEDVKNAFEQVYRDVGILDADLRTLRLSPGVHYVAVLHTAGSTGGPPDRDKPAKGEVDPAKPEPPEGILELKSLEEILASSSLTDHRFPDADGKGEILQAVPDAAGTGFKFKFVDPVDALLTSDQIDKITVGLKQEMRDELDRLKAEIVKILTESEPSKKPTTP